MLEWCEVNFGEDPDRHRWDLDVKIGKRKKITNCTYCFMRADDAALFQLTWG